MSVEAEELKHDLALTRAQQKRDEIKQWYLDNWKAWPEEAYDYMNETEKYELLIELLDAYRRGRSSWAVAFDTVMNVNLDALAERLAEEDM